MTVTRTAHNLPPREPFSRTVRPDIRTHDSQHFDVMIPQALALPYHRQLDFDPPLLTSLLSEGGL